MLKYILTTNCNCRCKYCITRNMVGIHETDAMTDILNTLRTMVKDGHTHIMLTGGEPTRHRQFFIILGAALCLFDGTHITTTNLDILRYPVGEYFTSITYSIHNLGQHIPHITISVPVYAAIMAQDYTPELPIELSRRGFSGLTINEDQRQNTHFDTDLPSLHNDPEFTYKINRVGHCMDETFILPDLSICTNFRQWL